MEETEIEEESTTLRKYVTSLPVVLLFVVTFALSWKYFYTDFKPVSFLVVATLTAFAGYYPVRIKAHYANNEFSLTDYPVILGFFLLDPFQFGLAFILGYSVVLTIFKYSPRRLFINVYCTFYGSVITAALFRSPIELSSYAFIPLCIAGLILFNFLDTLSFYAVCKFNAKDIILYINSPEKFISISIGICLGVPTCIVLESRPVYAPILFSLFVLCTWFVNKYYDHVARNAQLKLLLDFMNESSNGNNTEQNDDRLLEIAKTMIYHDGIKLSFSKPGPNETGCILYSGPQGDRWLLVDKADYSQKRAKKDAMLLAEIAATSKKAYEHRSLQEQLFKAARYDSLTGLYNRSTLEEFLNHELGLVKRSKTQFSLMYIDLDKFKPINDEYGHKAGDELLTCIARRLKLTIRTQDIVARIGGDEFVIMCRDIDLEESKELALRISEEILKPVYISDTLHKDAKKRVKLKVEASIGIACAPKDGITFENLLKEADARMYKAKRSRKSVKIISKSA